MQENFIFNVIFVILMLSFSLIVLFSFIKNHIKFKNNPNIFKTINYNYVIPYYIISVVSKLILLVLMFYIFIYFDNNKYKKIIKILWILSITILVIQFLYISLFLKKFWIILKEDGIYFFDEKINLNDINKIIKYQNKLYIFHNKNRKIKMIIYNHRNNFYNLIVKNSKSILQLEIEQNINPISFYKKISK